jgi:hypothetical protein
VCGAGAGEVVAADGQLALGAAGTIFEVLAGDCGDVMFEVTAGAGGVSLELAPAGRVALKPTFEDGEPGEEAQHWRLRYPDDDDDGDGGGGGGGEWASIESVAEPGTVLAVVDGQLATAARDDGCEAQRFRLRMIDDDDGVDGDIVIDDGGDDDIVIDDSDAD